MIRAQLNFSHWLARLRSASDWATCISRAARYRHTITPILCRHRSLEASCWTGERQCARWLFHKLGVLPTFPASPTPERPIRSQRLVRIDRESSSKPRSSDQTSSSVALYNILKRSSISGTRWIRTKPFRTSRS